MEHFTPISAFSGGLLIGVGATILLLFNGRIAGISGIIEGLLQSKPLSRDWLWRLMFVLGLILGAAFTQPFVPADSAPRSDYPLSLLITGGMLVGFGTRLGNGCTSGHGVCGIARLSLRSVVATLVFMGTAALTVYFIRHVSGGLI